jgi:hypothetical protein
MPRFGLMVNILHLGRLLSAAQGSILDFPAKFCGQGNITQHWPICGEGPYLYPPHPVEDFFKNQCQIAAESITIAMD